MDESTATQGPLIPEVPAHDPYAALRHPDYRMYAIGNILAIIGAQAQDVAIGWELYERTHSKMALGLVGLVEILPIFLLTLPAGHVADRVDRRRILMVTQVCMALCSLGLAGLSWTRGPIIGIYALLFLAGITEAFRNPARGALLPQIVPAEIFSNAVTWNSTGFQMAAVAGPALGGLLIGVRIAGRHTATWVYVVAAMMAMVFFGFAARIRSRRSGPPLEAASLQTLIAGMRFVFQTRLVLAAITLDMFAVLLGGATTLLPVYAKDILHVGPSGLGWLRGAPSVGAFVMAIALAHLPPMQRAGRALLWAVAGFGVATIVFGVSKSFWLSLAMLVILGALDNISVVVRHTLVQLRTPDELRGRVSAVNSLFIGTSNQLGGFESGAVAQFLGPVFSVVAGGIGTVLVVLGVAAFWPDLRNLGRLRD